MAEIPPSDRIRDWLRTRLGCLFSAACLVLFLWLSLVAEEPRGDVFFTGLDDSAQTALAHSLGNGAPLVFRDDAFAAVPPEVRPDLLYRPGLPRKTRDLAHQLDPATLEARPFFQPFMPWQRAHLPGLPSLLVLATFLLVWIVAKEGTAGIRFRGFGTLLFLAVAIPFVALLPWGARFATGPYAEAPATLFAAFALSLAFFAGTDARPWVGAAVGLCLGLAVCFHPILAAWVVPIALFAVLRRGAWRYTLALALGAAAGLAPLVWSTLFVTAPYGNFLSAATLRAMIRRSPDIRALALALAAAVPLGVAGLALAHAPRLRAAAVRPRVRTAVAAACGAAVLVAPAAAWLHPAARRALAADADGLFFALPALAAAVALALAWRRPAACFLLAAGAFASLPYFVVQGQEVHVGAWSLRRSLAPLVLFFLAAFFAAFETTGREAVDPAPFRRRPWWRAGLLLLAALCAAVQIVRLPADDRETDAGWIVREVEDGMTPDGLYLFDYFPFAAPFAGAHPDRAIFGLNQGVAKELRHDRVVGWLRDECGKRPTWVVAGTRGAAGTGKNTGPRTVLESGLALDDEPLCKARGFLRSGSRDFMEFRFLRARPPRRGDGTQIGFGHSPFGLSGAWDALRPGKPGRWARVGAGFWGPVPEPGGSVELEFETAWTPPPGADWPVQKLLVLPPWKDEPVVLEVRASAGRHVLRATATRPADDYADIPPSALWRLSAVRVYDPATHGLRGYPPDLVVPVFRIRATCGGAEN